MQIHIDAITWSLARIDWLFGASFHNMHSAFKVLGAVVFGILINSPFSYGSQLQDANTNGSTLDYEHLIWTFALGRKHLVEHLKSESMYGQSTRTGQLRDCKHVGSLMRLSSMAQVTTIFSFTRRTPFEYCVYPFTYFTNCILLLTHFYYTPSLYLKVYLDDATLEEFGRQHDYYGPEFEAIKKREEYNTKCLCKLSKSVVPRTVASHDGVEVSASNVEQLVLSHEKLGCEASALSNVHETAGVEGECLC